MKNSYKIFLLSILLLSNFVAFAQPEDTDGGGGGGGGIEGNDPGGAPIDSNLILLAILGLMFGFYVIKKYQKQFN